MDKTRLLCILIYCLIAVTSYADNFTSKFIDESIVEKLRGISGFSLDNDTLNTAQEIYANFNSAKNKEAITEAVRFLSGELNVYAPTPKNITSDAQYTGASVYIFISASVPESTLKNYVKEADGNTVFILRGTIGEEPSLFMPTVDFVTNLSCGVSHNELREDTLCKEINIDINPELYHKYGISRVPSVVVLSGDTAYKHTGAVPVGYVQDKIKELKE